MGGHITENEYTCHEHAHRGSKDEQEASGNELDGVEDGGGGGGK